jgi:hypothetical protein
VRRDRRAGPTGPARAERSGDPTVMMLIRKTSRAENRARHTADERHYNRQICEARIAERRRLEQARIIANDEPAPF